MAASAYLADEFSYPAVEVIQVAEDWYVRVVGPEGEIIKSFAVESRALDFAAEQCLRLNLEGYDRL
jgi:hypothetical protein